MPRTTLSAIWVFLLVSALYTLCIVIYFYPYFPIFSEALIGPPEDNMMDFWNIWYSQVTMEHNFMNFFHTNLIKYPEGTSLYFHSFSYSNLFIIFLIRKLFSWPISTVLLVKLHNGMLLFSFYLAAVGAFYLTRMFTRSNVSAFFGGFIFAFSPFHIAHMLHHMHVATIQYIPFFLICFFGYMDTRKILFLAGSIFFYWLSALSCLYYLIYIGYFMGFFYIYKVISEKKLLLRECLAPIITILLGVILLLSPLVIPMITMSFQSQKVYLNGESYFNHVADLAGFFVFHPYHLLSRITRPLWSRFQGNLWEMAVYLGSINLALFLWAYLNRRRFKIKEMNFLLSGILVFMILASGPYLFFLGKKIIPLPTYVLGVMPFFKHIRTPSRAVVFVYLFLGIGVGLAIDTITNLYKKRNKVLYSLSVIILLLLVFLDFYPTRLESTAVQCLPAYQVITEDKEKDFGIADLPVGYTAGSTYMMYQAACHGRPIVVATAPEYMEDRLSHRLDQDDMTLLKEQFVDKRVKYLVLHKNIQDDKLTEEEITRYTDSFKKVYSDQDTIVLQVY